MNDLPSLKQITRRSITSKHFSQAFRNTKDLPDQAAALICGAYVERALEIAIRSRLIRLKKEDMKGLFENGPLQNMIGKNRIGFALALYSRAAYNDIEKIRLIRNAFAHSFHPLKFDNRAVKAHCHSLTTVKRFRDSRVGVKYPSIANVRAARRKFIASAVLIGICLENYKGRPRRARRFGTRELERFVLF